MNVRLTIEYDGTAYSGWQVQPRQKTIQGEIEAALTRLTSQKVTLHTAGRTDSGVHALAQTANFKIDHTLPVEKYRDGLNFYLPNDILIATAEVVDEQFHSRYSAIYRKYRYLIASEKSAINRFRRWEVTEQLDLASMNNAAGWLIGERDFASCCVISSQKENNECILYDSAWTESNGILIYDVTANRFLHNMIRSLVGLMYRLGRHDIGIKQFREIISSGDHRLIKKTAPACGLYLVGIGY